MYDIDGFEAQYTKKLWEQFTQGQSVDFETLPKHVKNAWMLCKENNLNPKDVPTPRRLSAEKLASLRTENALLIEIARPILDMIKVSISDTKPIVILTAASNIILEVAGSESSLSPKEAYYNAPGIICDEKILGSRATTLAMRERKPLFLAGHEHFFEVFHESLCYAAPIFDHDKNIIASISIATSLKHYHPHTMGMLAAAAENVASQLQKKDAEQKKQYLNSLVYSICNSLPEAVVALDEQHIIQYVNDIAGSIFMQTAASMLGKEIFSFIHSTSTNDLLRAISLRKQSNIPIYLESKGIENRHLCRVQPLDDAAGVTVGVTLFIASEKQLAKEVSKIGGNRSYYEFKDILGNSQQIQHCVQLAKKVAKKATRVLITGESGTGKELFAQAIHNASPRRAGPFVAISCASIPRDLVEAELFGYVAGAFTGANKGGAMGKFELAQDGTLFLDEINSLPMEAQGKILRALQQNEIVKVGGKSPIAVNAHVISATNMDLTELVEGKKFREDLLYRLNSVEIHIPPLRERKDDTEVLIRHFIARHAHAQNRRVRITAAWLGPMLNHSWQGNIRELENACEYAMILCEDNTLKETHLPPHFDTDCAQAKVSCENMDDAYKKWLCNGLYACRGNLSSAASKLGISRGTLYRKMKKYNLESMDFRTPKAQKNCDSCPVGCNS